MKKLISFVAVVIVTLITAACSVSSTNEPDINLITSDSILTGVDISVTYQVSVQSMNAPKRAAASLSTTVDKIVYIIMQDSTVYQTIRQETTDSNFGALSANLPIGDYSLYIYASRNGSDIVVNNNGTINVTKAGEGFSYICNFSINRTTRTSINALLTRCVAKINVDATDTKDDAVSVSLRISGNASTYDLANNTGIVANDYVVENISMSNRTNPFGLASYILLPEEESTITVAFVFKYADNSTREVIFEDVPMKRNCVTNLSGALFHEHGVDQNITINTTWGVDINVER